MPEAERPTLYDLIEALARRTEKRRAHQAIPHASVDEIAHALGEADEGLVRTSLDEAISEGYVAEHPEYKDMYYVTDAGDGFRDAAVFNG
ncbi:MAG TPA: hypothetical protein VK501_10435 [Baekduia sp.]|uniref:hypothetical protein n=1 Tax=Baekduia sp. TaxID=2600305 RepID=UPI002B857033|nr:hypothetical protein [Baekduia sp.]HMJ34326.1 hypothetical protein [Baekduia sp.]